MQKTIAAIICAYNEQSTIESIIRNVLDIPLFDECIVVNDGSTDRTGILIRQLKIEKEFHDIHLANNKGKGYAMATACEYSESNILVFIDADLSNFTSDHAFLLLNPLLTEEADMVIGQATDTVIRQEINPFKKLSGQRAILKKDIVPILKRMKSSGYGVETLINLHYKANSKLVKSVILDKLIHKIKFEKTKPHKAIKEFLVEGFEIFHTMLANTNLARKAIK